MITDENAQILTCYKSTPSPDCVTARTMRAPTQRCVRDSLPILERVAIQFIPDEYHTTTIMNHKALRGVDGRVAADEKGFPRLINQKLPKLPGPGKNDSSSTP